MKDIAISISEGFIPEDLYHAIHPLAAWPCVDIVVHMDFYYFLLVKRHQNPLKGEWWLPGGRIWKGESLLKACKRHLKDDTGLIAQESDFDLLGPDETFFETDPFGHGKGTHTINIVYSVSFGSTGGGLPSDSEQRWQWFTASELQYDYLQRWAARIAA